MGKTLKSLWSREECPILNGVMFADGYVECIEPFDQPRPAGTIRLAGKGRVLLASLEPVESTGVMHLCRAEDDEKGLIVIGGECGMGEDGFIAVTDFANRLQWLAFFDFSNPFVTVGFLDDEIIAVNNLGETWRFPLANPAAVSIEVAG